MLRFEQLNAYALVINYIIELVYKIYTQEKITEILILCTKKTVHGILVLGYECIIYDVCDACALLYTFLLIH